jgi:DNA/RNA endonuclease YhcR with UshA esterase domain
VIEGTAMRAFKPWIIATAWAAWATAAQADPISPVEAAKHAGETATVCGLVAGAKYAAQIRGGLTFIDFEKPYPDATFTAVIFAADRAKFGTPEKGLAGKRVCVTGKIEIFRGKPEVVLTDPKQLAVK